VTERTAVGWLVGCGILGDVARQIILRDAQESDGDQIRELLIGSWGSATVVSRGRARDAARLPAKVAFRDGVLVGLATFDLDGDQCELVTLDCLDQRVGIGTELLQAVVQEAHRKGAKRVWLTTSNDNLDAVRFYQRRGMRLAAVHQGAIDQARQIKPSIPLVGDFGIAIHDELELELRLDSPIA
jgi:N-acetylglutamate synthase-like GNAT family acetyltransferase